MLRMRQARGYSLVEMIIVVVLTAVLAGVLFKWVTSIVSAAQAGGEVSAVQSTVSQISNTFRSDTERAAVCSPQGLSAPLRATSPSSIQVYKDDNNDGVVDLVVWKVQNDQLLRGVIPGNASCTFTDAAINAASLRVVASGVSAPVAAFSGVNKGVATAFSTNTCLGAGADLCNVQGIRLNVKVIGLGTERVPGNVTETFFVNSYGTRV